MLCVLRSSSPHFHGRCRQQLFIPPIAGRWIRDGIIVHSFEHAGSSAGDVGDEGIARRGEGRFRKRLCFSFGGLLSCVAGCGGYVVLRGLLAFFLFPKLRTELFPNVDAGQFQLRLRVLTGTRIERTELMSSKHWTYQEEVGPENVRSPRAFIGVQPRSNR